MVYAEVNHGRWIVRCPNCPSAEQVTIETDFRCREEYGGCGHTDRIKYPKERDEIERLLVGRLKQNRNWLPGETPAALYAENLEHGVTSWRG